MNAKPDPKSFVLDEEEQYFEDHFDEFVPADPAIRSSLMEAAAREPVIITGKKQMVSIRLAPTDVQAIKEQAARLGFAYQALISSLLHQYARGELINIADARKMLEP